MGSVISNIECPRCKSEECFEDYYYKSGEFYISCPDCGYHHSVTIKRDENGNCVFKTPANGLVEGNYEIIEVKIENPFGAYRLMSDSGGGIVGTLETESDYISLKENLNKSIDDKSVQSGKLVISRFIIDKIVIEEINLKSYED